MMCMLMLRSDTRLWFVCGMNWRNRSSVLGFWIIWSLAPLLSINPEEKVMAECPEERETTIQGILDEMAIKAEQKLGIQRGLDISKIFKHNITVSNSVINLWISIYYIYIYTYYKHDISIWYEHDIQDDVAFMHDTNILWYWYQYDTNILGTSVGNPVDWHSHSQWSVMVDIQPILAGLPDLLRCSALFRAANPDFMKLMRHWVCTAKA